MVTRFVPQTTWQTSVSGLELSFKHIVTSSGRSSMTIGQFPRGGSCHKTGSASRRVDPRDVFLGGSWFPASPIHKAEGQARHGSGTYDIVVHNPVACSSVDE